MTDKLDLLIKELENTDTYNRENALIDLYLFLISENRPLPKLSNTFIFVELSKWRDCSLRDSVESYYEAKNADELLQLEESMEKYANQEACKRCIAGSHIYRQKGDFTSLDNWILDNEWGINDFLVELTQ